MQTLPLSEVRETHAPLGSLWLWLREACKLVKIQRRERSLRICESLSLGEKRSIAVVEFEAQRFLLGITAENICLLQNISATAVPASEKKATEP